MKQQFGLIKRPWGVYYLKNKTTGEQTSLKTRDWAEAERLLQAHNETKSQPHFNLALARVYINGADPKLITRTWQEVMEHIVTKKTDETRRRWDVAVLDKNFDCIRHLPVAETRPEHFDRALADGKVSSNVYLRRIHNHALGMEWLLKSVIPRLQWPKPVFKQKRAITSSEHAARCAFSSPGAGRSHLEILWRDDYAKVCAAQGAGELVPRDFPELVPYLADALSHIHRDPHFIRLVNSDRHEAPDFSAGPVWKILVGGNTLSRGYTIEGLTISYYRRVSNTADTLMQMGRWFGFRPGYRDLAHIGHGFLPVP
jgi:hypothetical protein